MGGGGGRHVAKAVGRGGGHGAAGGPQEAQSQGVRGHTHADPARARREAQGQGGALRGDEGEPPRPEGAAQGLETGALLGRREHHEAQGGLEGGDVDDERVRKGPALHSEDFADRFLDQGICAEAIHLVPTRHWGVT